MCITRIKLRPREFRYRPPQIIDAEIVRIAPLHFPSGTPSFRSDFTLPYASPSPIHKTSSRIIFLPSEIPEDAHSIRSSKTRPRPRYRNSARQYTSAQGRSYLPRKMVLNITSKTHSSCKRCFLERHTVLWTWRSAPGHCHAGRGGHGSGRRRRGSPSNFGIKSLVSYRTSYPSKLGQDKSSARRTCSDNSQAQPRAGRR